ncbi:hypothetical protein B0H19DRAFT_662888 [Mycena capillaripes]|nr:hypothetical protein B0H19DRAFT_662888 [Mycena capillaripes]
MRLLRGWPTRRFGFDWHNMSGFRRRIWRWVSPLSILFASIKLSSSPASGPPTSMATSLVFTPPTSIASSTGTGRSSTDASTATSLGFTSSTFIASSSGIEGSSTGASTSSPSSQVPSVIISAPPNGLSKSTSHDARTAAIAGSIISFAFLVGVLFLLLWLIQRRRRIHEGRLPYPYNHAGGRTPTDTWRDPSLPAAREKPGEGASPIGSPYRNAARLGLEVEQPTIMQWDADVAQNDPPRSNEDVGLRIGAMDNGMPPEERLNLRIRRVEVQLDAILRLGLPESAPPSYTSEN